MKKIIIAAGGTGGHLYPGICLARSLREIGVEVIFIVKKGDICIPLLKESNFNYFTLKIIGMPRTLSVRFVFFVIKMFFATLKSLLLIKKEKPGVIAGFGGYISFPAVFAAKILG
ncbi:MAG: glycosyltransferase, partial [Elusimicrobiota bacterium]